MTRSILVSSILAMLSTSSLALGDRIAASTFETPQPRASSCPSGTTADGVAWASNLDGSLSGWTEGDEWMPTPDANGGFEYEATPGASGSGLLTSPTLDGVVAGPGELLVLSFESRRVFPGDVAQCEVGGSLRSGTQPVTEFLSDPYTGMFDEQLPAWCDGEGQRRITTVELLRDPEEVTGLEPLTWEFLHSQAPGESRWAIDRLQIDRCMLPEPEPDPTVCDFPDDVNPGAFYDGVVRYQRNNQQSFGSTYEGIFGPWGNSSATLEIELRQLEYFSIPMNTPASGAPTKLIWDIRPFHPDEIRISVSRCPGPPSASTAVSSGCFLQANGATGLFAMNLFATSSSCSLEPSSQYFLNVGSYDAAGESACGRFACIWLVKEI